MTATQTQQPSVIAKPAKAPEDPGPLTYFLLVDDEHDSEAGRKHLDDRYGPGTRGGSKRVTEIRVGRLTEEHVVIPVFRIDIEAGQSDYADPDIGRPRKIRLDPKIGMVEGKPVHCCNHWVASEHEDGDGSMRMATFLEELGKSCAPPGMQKRTTPPAPRYRPDDQILRLRFT